MTEIEWALRQPDDPQEDDESGAEVIPALYDFAEEIRILRLQGTWFKWLRIPSDYPPTNLLGPFTDDIANEYLKQARKFFSDPVRIETNPDNLYEDEEGAVIVSLFRKSDRRIFYVLDQLRRVIDGNAPLLICWQWLSFLLMAFGFMGIALIYLFKQDQSFIQLWGEFAFFLENPLIYFFPGLFVAAGIIISFYLQRVYEAQQQHNLREFSDYLTRHFGFISNRFREASAYASRVIQGDERNSKILAANAQKWHKNLMWLAMRPFFIESFVRNVNFQIRRNLGYYLMGAGVLYAITGMILFSLFIFASTSSSITHVNIFGASAIIGSILIPGLISYWQVHRKVVLIELDQMNWLGFDNLEVGKQMDDVIGKYAEDIGLWKGRFDR